MTASTPFLPLAALSAASSPHLLSRADRIDAALPQTQCTRCGYPNCRAYAEAIDAGAADINQCPPGGDEGVQRLAALTGRAANPLNPANGSERPRPVAVIDEDWCIGCTLCLDVCPTDAILGSNKLMHTVIEPYCTGCELCIPVCPVDCISLENATGERTGWQAWSQAEADTARRRYEFHSWRRTSLKGQSPETLESNDFESADTPSALPVNEAASHERKRAVIEAALARARSARQEPGA